MANIVELRDMPDSQLEEKLEDNREELFNLRFRTATSQLEDYSRIRTVRREVAQLQEALHKRRAAVDTAAGHPEIAAVLDGQEWSGAAHFDYEASAWLVEFTDDDGETVATASVNLNKIRRSTRRARRGKRASERVKNVEVTG